MVARYAPKIYSIILWLFCAGYVVALFLKIQHEYVDKLPYIAVGMMIFGLFYRLQEEMSLFAKENNERLKKDNEEEEIRRIILESKRGE